MAEPPTSGHERDVPLAVPTELPEPAIAQYVPTPCATTSGFVRLSHVGPRDENPAMVLFVSTAPTETMLSASAGQVTLVTPSAPSLPIELQTTMPRRCAMTAPCVTIEVRPSMS